MIWLAIYWVVCMALIYLPLRWDESISNDAKMGWFLAAGVMFPCYILLICLVGFIILTEQLRDKLFPKV